MFRYLLLLFGLLNVSAIYGQQVRSDTASTEAVQLLSTYLTYPSLTGDEDAAAEYLASVCEENGLVVQWFDREPGSHNFAASLYPLSLGKPNVILEHHIDVVTPLDTADWKYPPFGGTVAEGIVWGRGAIDAKGIGIMQLVAMLDFVDAANDLDLPYNVTLLAVSGEEAGGYAGSAKVVRDQLPILNAEVVLGEGGGGLRNVLVNSPDRALFGVSVADKSNLWLSLELKFEGGHGAAAPVNYVNQSMLEALSNITHRKSEIHFSRTTRTMFKGLGKAEGGLRGFVLRHINWVIFRPFLPKFIREQPLLRSFITNTVTLTNYVNPPGSPNVISNKATAVLDCRLLPNMNPRKFIRELKGDLKDDRINISILDKGVDAKPTKPDKYFELLKAAIDKDVPNAAVVPVLFPASTDNNYYRAAGIPTYGLIPAILQKADIRSVHNIDERISVETLEQGVRIYKSFLEKLMFNDDQEQTKKQ